MVLLQELLLQQEVLMVQDEFRVAVLHQDPEGLHIAMQGVLQQAQGGLQGGSVQCVKSERSLSGGRHARHPYSIAHHCQQDPI